MVSDKELEELLKAAQQQGEDVKESRLLNEIEKFITVFELKPSETTITPFWAIYRGYRLWMTTLPLSQYLFRREIVKYFRKADKWGTTAQKSYFVEPGKLDLSDNGYWAEKREHKERERKAKYADKPYMRFRGHWYKRKKNEKV
jgi:hypothetical protein